MKKIITLALSLLMLVSCMSFTFAASAQDNGVMFSFSYQEKCNGVVDGKKTATTEKVTIDGVKALKITPTPATALASEIRLDCYSLTYPVEQLSGVRYMSVKYRFDGSKIPSDPMKVQFFAAGGSFSKSVSATAKEKIGTGAWKLAVFDISALDGALVKDEGKLFKQFHFWPYGANSNPANLDGQIMYIGDISFHTSEPSAASMNLPAIVDAPATVAPTATTTTQTADVNYTIDYPEKNKGIVDGKKTASVEKVTVDGIKAIKITPTPDTALSNEIRLDCHGLGISSNNIKGAKYITVKYRYDGAAGTTKPMVLWFLTSGGVLAKSMDVKCAEAATSGGWKIAVFDATAFGNAVVADSTFNQFHFWPYGQGVDPKGLSASDVMYIGDITFSSKAPEGVSLPTTTGTATPAAGSDVNFVIDYPEKNKGIVDGKKTASVEKVTVDGVKAVKITPTPDTALSNEIRLDLYGLGASSNSVKGTKYITVKYKYEGKADSTKEMVLHFFTSGGVLTSAKSVKSMEAATSGGWKTAVFEASAFGSAVVADATFNQFHFWPYGQGVDPKGLTSSDVMYIGEITFTSKTPEGVAAPSTPSAPSTTPAAPSEALKGDENGFLIGFNYTEKCNGVVDGKKTANVEKPVEIDGQKAVKITPTPDTALTSELALDSYSFYTHPNNVANARFMAIKYKLVAPETAELNPMGIRIIGGTSKRIVTKSIDTESLSPIVNGEWATAIFNVSLFKDIVSKEDANLMLQFHLYPFGKRANVKSMNENFVMYISDISFYTVNPDPNTTYKVSFKKGHPDVSGADPETMTVKRGDKITLPDITSYDLGDAKFLGWKSSEDDKLYAIGAEYTIPDNDVAFTATFDMNEVLHDFLALPFIQYHNNSCDGRDNIIVTEEVLQGKEVVKVVPNPTGETANISPIVDGYKYGPAGIDLSVYKYLVITYYYDGDIPKDFYFYANVMRRTILTKNFGVRSSEPITAGRWNFAVLDFTGATELLVPELSSHVVQQMHIYPFDGAKTTDFKGNEALYINNLMFFKEKPNLNIHESYMKGYDGGIFKPQGNMTRAEACTIVARLMAGDDASVPADKTTAFADVTADKWYYKYISYVESLGYLKGYSGNFLPDQAITRAEFVELVYNMGLLKDAGKNGTFTDVAADHPKAAVISAAGKAGLVNGYDNGDGTFSFKPDATITRAEVVKVINNAYGRSITKNQLSAEVKYSFNDVAKDFWAYADIMEATLAHVEDDKGWIFCMVSPFTIFGKTNDNLNYAAGEQYVKDLDVTSAERIAAIKNTPNMDLSKITGTKYYISNNGNDEADGKSPETAWKTIARMVKESSTFKPGDAVLFERGGLWREPFSTKSGVTYTAYGEGAKPIIYGSPENGAGAEKWTLMEGTTNIWVYANELIDVGGIICDNGKVIGLKEVPDLINGSFYIRKSKGTKPFDIKTELNENYEFFSEVTDSKNLATAKGKLYFRCDEGNPGALFSQIEFNIKGSIIRVGNTTDVTVDNIALFYTGTHGIGSGTTKNLTVTNCEIGWIGGTIQSYNSDGVATRLGNGVEIYGGCDGFLVDNNYIWQCYDAGATHQYSKGGINDISMYNATYSNNVIEDCIYNIEYFTGIADDEKTVRDGKNFVIKNNILRRAGYGWGNQRPDGNTSAHIKSWTHGNNYEKGTFIIENNVFDRAAWKLVQTTATYAAWCPIYKNNTYVQVIDEGLCHHAALDLKYDCFAEESIKYELGDDGAVVYFLPTSYKHQGFLSR